MHRAVPERLANIVVCTEMCLYSIRFTASHVNRGLTLSTIQYTVSVCLSLANADVLAHAVSIKLTRI